MIRVEMGWNKPYDPCGVRRIAEDHYEITISCNNSHEFLDFIITFFDEKDMCNFRIYVIDEETFALLTLTVDFG